MTFYLPTVGLCARCAHHRVTGNRRGSQFHLCGLAATDGRYRKYPRLPVLRCDGFEVVEGDIELDGEGEHDE